MPVLGNFWWGGWVGGLRPSGDSMPASDIITCSAGVEVTHTPPARAISLVRRRRLLHASVIATSDEEHAVSTAKHGPLRLRK